MLFTKTNKYLNSLEKLWFNNLMAIYLTTLLVSFNAICTKYCKLMVAILQDDYLEGNSNILYFYFRDIFCKVIQQCCLSTCNVALHTNLGANIYQKDFAKEKILIC